MRDSDKELDEILSMKPTPVPGSETNRPYYRPIEAENLKAEQKQRLNALIEKKVTDARVDEEEETHSSALQVALCKDLLELLPEIPFVSFEACRSAADYDERQALRKLVAELRTKILSYFGQTEEKS